MLGGSRVSDGRYDRLKLMASTGRPRTTVRPVRGSITLVKGVKRSVDMAQGEKQMAASVRCIKE